MAGEDAARAVLLQGDLSAALSALEATSTPRLMLQKAFCEYELEMYRAAVKTCDLLLRQQERDGGGSGDDRMRARVLQARALWAMGKGQRAKRAAQRGLEEAQNALETAGKEEEEKDHQQQQQGNAPVCADVELIMRLKRLRDGPEAVPVAEGGAGEAMQGSASDEAKESAVLPPSPPTQAQRQQHQQQQQQQQQQLQQQQLLRVPDAQVSELPETGTPEKRVRLAEMVRGLTATVSPVVLTQARMHLTLGTGDVVADNAIALGYLHVNTGKLDAAAIIFSALAEAHPRTVAAYIGRGSALAMKNEFDAAVADFSTALRLDTMNADAWKRRGQTYAAMERFDLALQDLNRAISLAPSDVDGFNQRGLAYHKSGQFTKAVADFRRVAEGAQVDTVLAALRNRADTQDEQTKAQLRGLANSAAPVMNHIAMAETQLGHTEAAEEAFRASMLLNPDFQEASLNYAQLLKEVGRGEECLMQFDAAHALRPGQDSGRGWHLRGMCAYGMGDMTEAERSFARALALWDKEGAKMVPEDDPVLTRTMHALSCHAMGQFRQAILDLNHNLEAVPTHGCWFSRELFAYMYIHLDRDLCVSNTDADFRPALKDSWIKSKDASEVQHSFANGPRESWYEQLEFNANDPASLKDLPADDGSDADETKLDGKDKTQQEKGDGGDDDDDNDHGGVRVPLASIQICVRACEPWQAFVQLRSRGFLRNRRQHRMFGMGVLQMAQLVEAHLHASDVPDRTMSAAYEVRTAPDTPCPEDGVWVADSVATEFHRAAGSTHPRNMRSVDGWHPLGYRDVFDVIVRWRQVSEPNDSVWWIDGLPSLAFDEGFGLHTPIVKGQLKTIRYYSYFPPAFALTKKLMEEQTTLRQPEASPADRQQQWTKEQLMGKLREATTLREVYDLVGHDFWVVTPCHSTAVPGRIMEGTRLTLVAKQPDGFEYSIRTPGTPGRWRVFDDELSACWSTYVTAARAFLADPSDAHMDTVTEAALAIFFYWVNFAPLSRGSAACGYAVLFALCIACGIRLEGSVPPRKQIDWEAILRPTPDSFIAGIRRWFFPMRKREPDALANIPNAFAAVPSFRAMLVALRMA